LGALPVDANRQGNTTIDSFNQAKKILIKKIYRGHQVTFYCESQYTQGQYVIHNRGYVNKNPEKRSGWNGSILFLRSLLALNFLNGAKGILNVWTKGATLSRAEIVPKR